MINVYCCLKKEKSLSGSPSTWNPASCPTVSQQALQHTAPGWLAVSSQVTLFSLCIPATLAFLSCSINYLKISITFLPQAPPMLFSLHGRCWPLPLHGPASVHCSGLNVGSMFSERSSLVPSIPHIPCHADVHFSFWALNAIYSPVFVWLPVLCLPLPAHLPSPCPHQCHMESSVWAAVGLLYSALCPQRA